jgi:hypothetical protein
LESTPKTIITGELDMEDKGLKKKTAGTSKNKKETVNTLSEPKKKVEVAKSME